MGNLFGKKQRTSRITEQDRAILQLKKQRDDLIKYKKRLEQTQEKDRDLARKLIANGRRDQAILLLRKKHRLDSLAKNADKQFDQLEQLVDSLEFAQIELKVVDGLKAGNSALKQLNALLNVEDIEMLMDETREGVAKQNEINELLNGERDVADETEDLDLLEQELDDLLRDQLPDVRNLGEPAVMAGDDNEVVAAAAAVPSKPKKIPVAVEA